MLSFNSKIMVRHWNESGQDLILPMLCHLCYRVHSCLHLMGEKIFSLCHLLKLINSWMARNQDPTLQRWHVLEEHLCHQRSQAQSCRTHFSLPCKDLKLHSHFIACYPKIGMEEYLEQAAFSLSREALPCLSGIGGAWRRQVGSSGRAASHCTAKSPQGKSGHRLPLLMASFMCK